MRYRKSDAKAYALTHMKGLWVANLTPFAADLTLDEPGFRRNLRHWIDDPGIGGVFITGKQAEFFSLSLAERKRILEIATDEAGDKCGVMMSCSDENLDTVLDLADHAQAAGADYIIVHSPARPSISTKRSTTSSTNITAISANGWRSAWRSGTSPTMATSWDPRSAPVSPNCPTSW
jgi:hypothetical protein